MRARRGSGRSAYGAVAVRAMEAFVPRPQRLFEDDLVIDFLPRASRFMLRQGWMRRAFAALMERVAPGIRGALLCRTCAIDDAVKAAVGRGLRTMVILGAGLDSRPYRLRELRDALVIEADLPSVQAFKKERLMRRFGALPAHVRFMPIDFNVEPLDAALRRNLPAGQPAIFLWEGVTQYLQPEAADAVFRMIAAQPEGSDLIFTYVLEEVITGRFHPDRSEEFRKSASVRPPAPWLFGIDPSQLKAFLAERGLTLKEDLGADEHIARYLQPRGRDLAVSEIERVALAVV